MTGPDGTYPTLQGPRERGGRLCHWARIGGFVSVAALAACVQQPESGPKPGAGSYTRQVAPAPGTDANVYTFRHEGPNQLGTSAVTAQPTTGPDAAPNGTLAGPDGRAKAEAAAVFYAENALCQGGGFRLAGDAASRYDAASNSWTVFGRCVNS